MKSQMREELRLVNQRSPKPNGESGSALLIVFVFAAVIAIMLYRELPVDAFEAQRQKEELLVDRGNEYARGVKLFVRKVGQYPQSFDALENTNRMRVLRRRFKDPMTGKDDWRLLHAGPGGMLIDSKVKSPGPGLNPNAPNSTSNAIAGNTGLSPNNGSSFGSNNSPNSGFGATAASNGSANTGF